MTKIVRKLAVKLSASFGERRFDNINHVINGNCGNKHSNSRTKKYSYMLNICEDPHSHTGVIKSVKDSLKQKCIHHVLSNKNFDYAQNKTL